MLSQSKPPPSSEHYGHHGNPVRVGVMIHQNESENLALGRKRDSVRKRMGKKEWGVGRVRGETMRPHHEHRWRVMLSGTEEQRQQLSPVSDVGSAQRSSPDLTCSMSVVIYRAAQHWASTMNKAERLDLIMHPKDSATPNLKFTEIRNKSHS